MQLIASGNLGAVRMFAAKHRGVLHARDKHAVNPLEYAIIQDQMAIFLWLLSEKVNLNQVKADGSTILSFVTALIVDTRFHYAEKYIKPLLKAGADPNAGNHTFKALHLAANRGSISIIELLLSYGADINAIAPPPPYNASAIDTALAGHHSEAATFLITRGASLNVSYFLSFSAQMRNSEWLAFPDFITQLQYYAKYVSAGVNVKGVINICNALYILEQKGADLDEWKADCSASIARTRGPDDTNDKLCAAIQFLPKPDFCEIIGKIEE